jgi:small GTP-binding protein
MHIKSIPDELVIIILSYLSREDLNSVSLVSSCGSLSRLSHHNLFWESVFHEVIDQSKETVKNQSANIVHYLLPRTKTYLTIDKANCAFDAYKRALIAFCREQEEIHSSMLISAAKGKEYIGKKFVLNYFDNERVSKAMLLPDHCKVVVIGDKAVGKTKLIERICGGSFNEYDYVSACQEPHDTTELFMNRYCCKLLFWDTKGESIYDKGRPFSYFGAKIFLLCFSVTDPSSFKNVTRRWLPEIYNNQHYFIKENNNTNFPIILLIGTKIDLRLSGQASNSRAIYAEQGKRLAKKFKCFLYTEVSAKTEEGLGKYFRDLLMKCFFYACQDNLHSKRRCAIC